MAPRSYNYIILYYNILLYMYLYNIYRYAAEESAYARAVRVETLRRDSNPGNLKNSFFLGELASYYLT
jgi:hypothetical protein